MFGRLAQSLAKAGHEVIVVGASGTPSQNPSITCITHPRPPRFGLARWWRRWQIASTIFHVRPDILIVCTHELLTVAAAYKIFTGRRVWYDVQENYALNIRHTNAFPSFIRFIVAALVGLHERVMSPFLEHFLLAEACYRDQLPWISERGVVLENKVNLVTDVARPTQRGKRLLFSGTLADSTGVFQAIAFAKELYRLESAVHLTIIGYCAQQETRKKLEHELTDAPFITLIQDSVPVPHEQILEQIAFADFGIVVYPSSPHTDGKIPTKLYEYLACRLPMLLEPRPEWLDLCLPVSACMAVTLQERDEQARQILEEMTTISFYRGDTSFARWETEEAKLLRLL